MKNDFNRIYFAKRNAWEKTKSDYSEKRESWEWTWGIVAGIGLLLMLMFSSCTKEYSAVKSNVIYVSIKPENYVATVNGSTGNYWKIAVSISEPVTTDVKITYRFNDGSNLIELYGTMPKNTTENIFYSQYRANNQIANNIYIVSVDGLNGYDVRLK